MMQQVKTLGCTTEIIKTYGAEVISQLHFSLHATFSHLPVNWMCNFARIFISRTSF